MSRTATILACLVACGSPAALPAAVPPTTTTHAKRIDVRSGVVSRDKLQEDLAAILPHVRSCLKEPRARLIVDLEWQSRGFVEVSGGGGGYVADKRGEFAISKITFPRDDELSLSADARECIGVCLEGFTSSVKSNAEIEIELEL